MCTGWVSCPRGLPCLLVYPSPWCHTQVVEYNETSSLHEQLLQMRKTGVYISVHTSNLANAPLLQPGSAVFEIIQVRTIKITCA